MTSPAFPKILFGSIAVFAVGCVCYYPFSQAAAASRGMPISRQLAEQLKAITDKDPRFSELYITGGFSSDSGAGIMVGGTVDEKNFADLQKIANSIHRPPEVELLFSVSRRPTGGFHISNHNLGG